MTKGEKTILARKAFDAFSRRDLDLALEYADPEIEFYALTGEVAGGDGTNWERGAYWGHEGLQQFFADVAEVWEELEAIPEDFRDTGEHLLVQGRLRGKRRDGATLDIPAHWVWKVSDAKVSYWCVYTDLAEALEAVGINR
jgi:ketosteroid isomerase-like protein